VTSLRLFRRQIVIANRYDCQYRCDLKDRGALKRVLFDASEKDDVCRMINPRDIIKREAEINSVKKLIAGD